MKRIFIGQLFIFITLILSGINCKFKRSKNIFNLEIHIFEVPQLSGFLPKYTAEIYVANYSSGKLSGPYTGSTFPDSYPSDYSKTDWNTVLDTTHIFNNHFGHGGGSKKGINIVSHTQAKYHEERITYGVTPSGDTIDKMKYVNIHSGVSEWDSIHRRGSWGCITIHPLYKDSFFNCFEFKYGMTGIDSGGVYIYREEPEVLEEILNMIKCDFQ